MQDYIHFSSILKFSRAPTPVAFYRDPGNAVPSHLRSEFFSRLVEKKMKKKIKKETKKIKETKIKNKRKKIKKESNFF